MAPKDKEEAVSVTAESSDHKKSADDKAKDKKKGEESAEETMSEEDLALKERLETSVTVVLEEESALGLRQNALDVIVNELRSATSSMTSVPKPLKFLRPHYESVDGLFKTLKAATIDADDKKEFRARLGDVLSVLAMTMGNSGEFT